MTTTPTPWSLPIQANTTDAPQPPFANIAATDEQSHAKVTALAGGGYLVTWEDWSTNYTFGLEPRDIVGRIYDALGNPVGGEHYLSGLYGDLDQKQQDVAAFTAGGFAVAYQTTDATSGGGFGFNDLENVIVEVYNAAGTAIRYDDYRQGLAGPAGIDDIDPAIAAFANGGYVLAYATDAAGNYDIVAYVVDSAGVRSGPFTLENGAAAATRTDAAVLANQSFAVVYELANGTADIGFALRSSSGAAIASGVVAGGAGAESAPAVAALAGGGFVVAWTDSAGDGAANSGIKARLYSAAGTASPTVLHINTNTAGTQDQAAVTALSDGGFVVAWHDAASGTVEAARFDASGAQIGVQITIGDVDTDSGPALALLGDGRFVTAFTNTDGTGNANVYGEIWDPRTTVTGTNSGDVLTSRVDGAFVAGNGGNDTIYAGAGTDTLNGGLGNDTYINPEGDTIVESAGFGIDTVYSFASITLAAEVERLFLQGGAAVNGTGNASPNQLVGNTGANTLSGLTGNDTLLGGAGADTLSGGAGSDLLHGGTQRDKLIPGVDADADTVAFNVLNESTGVTRDVIDRIDLGGEDKIDLPVIPTAIAAAITSGTLSTATFNADLAAAVNAAALPAGQAVLFDPSAGTLDQPGMTYLIVDANGLAGYQAGQDWVFQLENPTGTLDPTDFI